MQKMYKPARIAIVFIMFIALLGVFITNLYRIQIHEARALNPYDAPQRRFSRTVNLHAARGSIYDRNGILLASGRPSFNIMLDWASMRAQGNDVFNAAILNMIYMAMDHGFTHTDTFPITRGAPFAFVDMTREQQRRFDAYIEHHQGLHPDITASEFLAWLRRHYQIDYTIGILDARLIIGVRHELEMRRIIGNLAPYVFLSDVTTDFISLIMEQGHVGVFTESSFVREYHTTYAAHLIGYIRRMSPQQFEVLRERGYSLDALVGQVGAEYAFEEYLRGIDGRKRVVSTVDGSVIEVHMLSEPIPGDHIYLTIDIDLQAAVEHALRTQISLINAERYLEAMDTGEDPDDLRIPGGAVVVVDTRTGELLAAASYPTFNLTTLAQDFTSLNLDPGLPLFNRATHGRYTPGSTFKMVTGFAGLRQEVVGRWTPIHCGGQFLGLTHLEGGHPVNCWIFPIARVGHHNVDMISATEVSCNVYFMEIAAHLNDRSFIESANTIADTAREFGLGVHTGLELPQSLGRLDSPLWRLDAYERGAINASAAFWPAALTIQTSFGQGENRFTPLQLASYTSTIANGGILFEQSILQRRMSNDFTEQLHTFEPVIRNVIEETEHINTIRDGMLAASIGNRGTARAVFQNYPILVGSKTGTAQFDSRNVNDGVFVAYAPHHNPEIAVAIVIEKGGSGSAVMDIARMIFDYYFNPGSAIAATPYGQLIP